MMKKLFFYAALFLSSSVSYAQNNATTEALKAANDMLYDVAHGKVERFDWLTHDELSRIIPFNNTEAEQTLGLVNNNTEKVLQAVIQKNRIDGEAAGIDWDSVEVTDIRYKSAYNDFLKTNEFNGFVFLKSCGKLFRAFFRCGFVVNGKWKIMLFVKFEQTNEIPVGYSKSGLNE